MTDDRKVIVRLADGTSRTWAPDWVVRVLTSEISERQEKGWEKISPGHPPLFGKFGTIKSDSLAAGMRLETSGGVAAVVSVERQGSP